ncbi:MULTISPECIES: uroporphyrinogen-III C-methyltransferase [unclassified Haladaptatus]|uniref:uroporphyrinogen-III C-methyltransferase n=1 Tax=unclassified Haladaptatus TaxID=2622732 RepID=UPI00209C6B30|nr:MULTISPECIES: uroporphyrinogen-III C-methyltransferase [unclassified Haladaptatus]MCO8246502.1 uroporphyrinogen-III C-methyltransferase [Haladaptatus sp. AB643]MCO8254740.1 uroporphyrinogen-III C-methyltransferase [Haladaptatus sp. AB618]
MSMHTGTVYLVGAGPGDPELLTVKARRLLDDADVVCHDNLADDRIVESCPETTERMYVGKRPGPDGERTTQEEINCLLVRLAREGKDVVRLKGGDPTVFGRGGEEAEHLAAAGIDFDIIPGISSAVAAPAVAGIPVTHRDHASSVTFVTGHEDPTKAESALDWDGLAATVRAGGTLVILMGVRRLPDNVTALRNAGLPEDTPTAMIEKATRDDEFTVTGTLDTIVERRDEVGIEPPAVTVVGDVVSVRDRVAEFLEGAPSVGVPSFADAAVSERGVE